MISVNSLLGEKRYKDVDVVTVTPTSLSARVDGKLVEIDLEATPDLNRDIQDLYTPEVKTFRIAQADLRSVRSKELDPEQTEAWLVVANPSKDEDFKPKNLNSAKFAAATSLLYGSQTGYVPGLTQEEIAAYPNVCRVITQAVSDGGQSSSRNGATVQYFQIHHSTMTSAASYVQMVQSGSREVSSTFAVQDSQIVRVVNLLRRPWTSGSATYDAMAFTCETANATLAPDYLVSEESKNSLGRIAKAMFLDRALGAITNYYIYLHKQMTSRFGVSYGTACPIDINENDIARRASAINIEGEVLDMAIGTIARIKGHGTKVRLYTPTAVLEGDTQEQVDAFFALTRQPRNDIPEITLEQHNAFQTLVNWNQPAGVFAILERIEGTLRTILSKFGVK